MIAFSAYHFINTGITSCVWFWLLNTDISLIDFGTLLNCIVAQKKDLIYSSQLVSHTRTLFLILWFEFKNIPIIVTKLLYFYTSWIALIHASTGPECNFCSACSHFLFVNQSNSTSSSIARICVKHCGHAWVFRSDVWLSKFN